MKVLKFGIVGVLCTLIDFSILIFLTEVLNINYILSAIISFSISVLVNYFLSIKLVFDVNNTSSNKLLYFIILSICGLLINEFIMILFERFLSLAYYFGKVIATGVVMVFNYITRKFLLERNNN